MSDEKGSHQLYWEDLRITGGKNPLCLARTTAGKASVAGQFIGPGSRHDFIRPIFDVYSEDGVGADWAISYQDLKPYYELLELEMPVLARHGFLGEIRMATHLVHTRWAGSATRSFAGARIWELESAREARWRSSPDRAETAHIASTAASVSRDVK